MHESKMEGYRSTRERLITEAMRLLSAKGSEATSVSQIEAAAALAFGSGALYRHFKSKDALLDAGIDRQLDRRHSMRDIRALFVGLGDLHSELTVLGRYILSVIDDELQPLQIAARAPAGHSARLDTAYAAFIDGLNSELPTGSVYGHLHYPQKTARPLSPTPSPWRRSCRSLG